MEQQQSLPITLNSSQQESLSPDLRKKMRPLETAVQGFLFFCGFVSIFTTLGILFVLGEESLLLFTQNYAAGGESQRLSVIDFLTTTKWQPNLLEIGIWPLLGATLVTSTVAIMISLPAGLGAAIYLSEYASNRARSILKPILEILAGIPTVVYGYFALTFVTPLLQSWISPILENLFGTKPIGVYNMLSAGLVMGVMIIPLIASLSEDALSSVPRTLREAAYGLGATQFEVTRRVVVPAATSGIIAALILAISRAVGETMIVAVASGAGPNFTFDPTRAAETMTGYIARVSTGDLSYNTLDYNSIFAIGLTLFMMTLILNMISRYVVSRFREVYE